MAVDISPTHECHVWHNSVCKANHVWLTQNIGIHHTRLHRNEACVGYFGIRILAYFFKGFWDICVFYFGIWDIRELGDIGYWNLFWATSKIYFGITVYFGIWYIAYPP